MEPKAGKRIVEIRKRKTKQDFAFHIKSIVESYPEAKKLRIVLDNLNTHFSKSLYETFDRREADSILSKIEFHYTPKHASWLNMAEIEIHVMETECLKARMKNQEYLESEVQAWNEARNLKQAKINWKFKKQDADKKLGKYYTT